MNNIINTKQCSEGYMGDFCSECQEKYWQDLTVCRSCGLDNADFIELMIALGVAGAFFIAMSIAVATLSSSGLAIAVANIILFQQFLSVFKSASTHLGDSESAKIAITVLHFAGILNFDLQIVKPGCAVGKM